MDRPFFSLLIPVFNAGNTIDRCVTSIIRQFENCEILLLDDGSTDDSFVKCEKLQKLYSRQIRLFHQENAGAVKTRRKLLQEASGEWIWFIDADDDITSDALKVLQKTVTDHPCDMVLFDYLEQSADGRWTAVHQLPLSFSEKLFSGKHKTELYRQAVCGNLNSLWNKIFHRGCIDYDADYTQYEKLKKGNDRLQAFPLLTNAAHIIYTSKPLYRYYYNSAGLTNTFGKHTLESVKTGIILTENYANQWSEGNPELFRSELALLRNRHIYQLITQFLLNDKQRITFSSFQAFFKVIIEDSILMRDYQYLPLSQIDSYCRQITKAVRGGNARKVFLIIKLRHCFHLWKNRFLNMGKKESI